jgi:hypothetical protein
MKNDGGERREEALDLPAHRGWGHAQKNGPRTRRWECPQPMHGALPTTIKTKQQKLKAATQFFLLSNKKSIPKKKKKEDDHEEIER